MKRSGMIRRIIITLMIITFLSGSLGGVAEGSLPSLTENTGTAMPSIAEALQRDPDSETENADGSVTEHYTNVSNADYETFSIYLQEQGAVLADYKLEDNVLTAEIQANDASFFLNFDIGSGEANVTYLAGTYGKKAQNSETQSAVNEQKGDSEQYKKIGATVTFGQYEQDNDLTNGPESIEWIVLDYDEKENKALLISQYGLDAQPYSYKGDEITEITWESCFLRNWLNGDFKKTAFTVDEQSAILMTDVDNSASQGCSEWNTTGGNNTKEQIFLLSYAETCQYFGFFGQGPKKSNLNLLLSMTPFASSSENHSYNKHETVNGEAAIVWWLRSPGENQETASTVFSSVLVGGIAVDDVSVIVRPALWLDLNAVERTLTPSAENNNHEETTKEKPDEAENEETMASYKRSGSIVAFGTYEQDNDPANGPEAIEWVVLDYNEKENKALLISKYGLDAFRYHSDWESTTWEGCTGRKWLNTVFLRSAFNIEEQKVILTTEVDNSHNQGHSKWKAEDRNNTQDQIFLLSFAEAEHYYHVNEWDGDESNIESRVAPTAYAIAQGAPASDHYRTVDGKPAGAWWLRSQTYGDNDAANVTEKGSCRSDGVNMLFSVRPVLWLDLEALEEILSNSANEDPAEAERNDKMATYSRLGNIVTYGRYEQDNNLENGLEPIEWIVLDYDGENNRSLLISKYGLDTITFDEWSTKKDITWEGCRARRWLNDYFLYSAFNKEERKAIPITEVDDSESNAGSTQDRIFLLSKSEASMYFGATNGAFDYEPYVRARVAPTAYAIAQGAYASDEFKTEEGLLAGSWLLRTYAGSCQGMNVNQGGTTNNEEFNTKHIGATVVHVARPVFWLDLNAVEDLLQSSAEKAKNDENPEEAKRKAIRDSYSRAGNIVTYGRYEQDNDLTNGLEPIEWIVLTYDEANNRALLISKYGLDILNFHNEWDPKFTVTWETCNARKWLNNVFLYSAFIEEERKAIPTTEVDNSDSLGLTKKQTVEVNNTQDRIFLLSNTEVKIYFEKGSSEVEDPRDYDAYIAQTGLRVAPTPYAIAQGAFISAQFRTSEGLPAGQWTTRTSCDDYTQGDYVREGGVFGDAWIPGLTGSGTEKVARPVFWLDLDAAVEVLTPSEEKQNHDENPAEAERKAKTVPYTRVRNSVTLGNYEQDNDLENGPEPIEWIVLDYDAENHRSLLISKYGLDAFQYHSERGDTTWAECTGRKWLNEDFMDRAFSEEERKAILITEVDNSQSQNYFRYRADTGNNTQDQIFLLSYQEAIYYFNIAVNGGNFSDGTKTRILVSATPYVIAQGVKPSKRDKTAEGLPAAMWCLRMLTFNQRDAAYIIESGNCQSRSYNEICAARPAFWLDLNADIF